MLPRHLLKIQGYRASPANPGSAGYDVAPPGHLQVLPPAPAGTRPRSSVVHGRCVASSPVSALVPTGTLAAYAQRTLLAEARSAGDALPLRCQAVHGRRTSKTPRCDNGVTD